MARNIKRLVPVTSEKKARRLSAKMPVIAVDMGFSSRKASCGLACDKKLSLPKKCTFGDLVKLFDQKFARKPFILIIEAPLSGAFNLKGNPAARIDKFEKIIRGIPEPALQ